jgi:hypothetical protein
VEDYRNKEMNTNIESPQIDSNSGCFAVELGGKCFSGKDNPWYPNNSGSILGPVDCLKPICVLSPAQTLAEVVVIETIYKGYSEIMEWVI